MFVSMKRILLLLLMCCAACAYAQEGTTPIQLGETYTLSSTILGEERKLNITLPEGYGENDTAKYPVIYLLDGAVDEDFLHMAGLVQFNSQSWVQRLPPCILVGIANTDRGRDMAFATTVAEQKEMLPAAGGSARFMDFIEQELKPWVAQHFLTNDNAMLVGQSLAGLFAAEVLLTRPQLFNKYIIVSPSLWWNNGSLLEKDVPAKSKFPRKTDVYIAVGKEGPAPTAEPHVMEVDANLLYDKLKAAELPNLRLYFDYLPEENHGTILHRAADRGFEWMEE